MTKVSLKNSPFKSPLKILLLSACVIVIIFNLQELLPEDNQVRKIRSLLSHQEVGQEFYGLDKILKNIPTIGYYTDKDLTRADNNARFSQAQYVIAPTILDINNTTHEFTLFDCRSENIAMNTIKEINATIIQKRSGLILTRKMK